MNPANLQRRSDGLIVRRSDGLLARLGSAGTCCCGGDGNPCDDLDAEGDKVPCPSGVAASISAQLSGIGFISEADLNDQLISTGRIYVDGVTLSNTVELLAAGGGGCARIYEGAFEGPGSYTDEFSDVDPGTLELIPKPISWSVSAVFLESPDPFDVAVSVVGGIGVHGFLYAYISENVSRIVTCRREGYSFSSNLVPARAVDEGLYVDGELNGGTGGTASIPI